MRKIHESQRMNIISALFLGNFSCWKFLTHKSEPVLWKREPFSGSHAILRGWMNKIIIAKAQRIRVLISFTKETAFKKHQNLKSKFNIKIFTKLQLDQTRLQNLRLNSVLKFWQRFSFKILTKIQLESLNEKFASKSWQNKNFNILTNI